VTLYALRSKGVEIRQPNAWREQDIWWHLALVHAWGPVETTGWNAPSWSISAEWFAYLLFPLMAPVLALIRSRPVAFILAGMALIATTCTLLAGGWGLNSWLGLPALIRVTGEFIAGAALGRAIQVGRFEHGDAIGFTALAVLAVGGVAGLPDSVLMAPLALLVLGAATAVGTFEQLLSLDPVVWIGEISYSIYMVHFPVLIALRRVLWFSSLAAPVAFCLMVAIVAIAAAGTHYLIERPARRLLRNLGSDVGLGTGARGTSSLQP
jgi:peptidoglycan/LPS O-acetylase OafA/YrhL